MTNRDADHRVETRDTTSDSSGRYPRKYGDGAANVTTRTDPSNPETTQLIEAMVERENMRSALQRVVGNRGTAGVDNMPVENLLPYLNEHWPRIKEELLTGRFKPSPVLEVEIPKPGGKGIRKLGIPTCLDRLIQQAMHQVMQPIFDPGFSEFSYGFRPGRSAHDAVQQARAHAATGRRWVVDMDLEQFFDRVNHDILMSRVARKVKDKRILKLTRRYLQAGVMTDGPISLRTEGTPQGGPLSPLLSNILLDDLDKELERRGHRFCRYADDSNVYVASKRAGERVLASITNFVETRLKLKVNQDKSAVGRPWNRKFLGYSMTSHKQYPRLKVAAESIKRLKGKIRARCRQGRGRNLGKFIQELKPLLQGWVNYFKLAEVRGVFEELDKWIRRKMRCIRWRQWKRPRTRLKRLRQCGLDEERARKSAYNGRGPWWNAGASHMNQAFQIKYFETLGLVSLLNQLRQLQSTS